MSDFRLKVIAETQKAERNLKAVGRVADEATRSRKLNIDLSGIDKTFSELNKGVVEASNNIKTFYSVSKKLPLIGSGVKTAEDTVKNLAKSTADLATAAPGATVGMVKASSAGSILSLSLIHI